MVAKNIPNAVKIIEINGAISLSYYAKKIHKNVNTPSQGFVATSKFEVPANIIVITKATNTLHMVIAIPLKNIEEEQKVDRATVEQISKIIRFLRNIED